MPTNTLRNVEVIAPSRIIGTDRRGKPIHAPCAGHKWLVAEESGAFITCLTCDGSVPSF